jgi:hypothetical protein
MANRVQGEATILESQFDPDSASRDGVDTNRDDGLVGLLAGKALGLPYAFALELHAPGLPVTVVQVRDRVPDKAEKLGLFDHIRIPVSLVVPVLVDPDHPERAEIDWKAFLALPDRVQRMKDAARRGQAASAGAAPAPAGMSAEDEATRLMIFRMAQEVQAGKRSLAELEMMCQQLVQVNQLSQQDADDALAAARGA